MDSQQPFSQRYQRVTLILVGVIVFFVIVLPHIRTTSPGPTTLFYRDGEEVYQVDVQTQVIQHVTHLGGPEGSKGWVMVAPDHSRVGYSPTTNPNRLLDDVFITDVATGEALNITQTNDLQETFYDWSPDSRYFVYAHDTGNDRDIYVRDTAGEQVINITDNAPNVEGWVRWSPDGTRIAYTSSRPFRRYEWGVDVVDVTIDADGTIQVSEPQRIVTDYGFVSHLEWSPDSQWLAYHSTDSPRGIWVVAADGSSPERLISNPDIREDEFAWSPDSQHLVIVSLPTGSQEELIVTDLEGKLRNNITRTPFEREIYPVWLNNEQIAYHLDGSIYTINPNGMNNWLLIERQEHDLVILR